MRIPGILALVLLAVAASPRSAEAYVTYDCFDHNCKWDAPVNQTPAVITWSFINDGAPINSAYQSPNDPTLDFMSGTSSISTMRTNLDTAFGAGAFDAAVSRAFDTWAAATNVAFVHVADNGAAFAGTTLIDIRIGAYLFSNSSSGAAGFGPPGNDVPTTTDPLAGDIAINLANNFTIVTGAADGDSLPTGPGGLYLNDIEGLLLHEIGHTLGLGHSNVVDGVMCGFPAACRYDLVNHVLNPDDVAGIQSIYGEKTVVPVPAAAWLMLSGIGSLAAVARRRRSVRITSDQPASK